VSFRDFEILELGNFEIDPIICEGGRKNLKTGFSMWIICENPLFLLPAYAKAAAGDARKH